MKIFIAILLFFISVNAYSQNFWEDLDTTGLRNYEDVINERYELLGKQSHEIPYINDNTSIKLKESNFEIENKLETDLELYPNPIDKGNLMFNSKETISSISIYDISGKEILNILNPNSNSINIDFLDRGNYIISFIFTNHNITNKKLVKL